MDIKKKKICSNEKSRIGDFKKIAKNNIPAGNKRFKKTWRDFVCDDSASVIKIKGEKIFSFVKFLDYEGNQLYGIITNISTSINPKSLQVGMEVKMRNNNDPIWEWKNGIVNTVRHKVTIIEMNESRKLNHNKIDEYDTVIPNQLSDRRWVYLDNKNRLQGPFTDDEMWDWKKNSDFF